MLTAAPAPWGAPNTLLRQAWEYWVDAAQRSTLFADVMRQRGNISVEHALQGKPPLLKFEYKLLIDGRTLAPPHRPCNYILLEMLPPEGVPVDVAKRPYVIVDPRAGHGPGIGGFKPDSQVGVAMRAGHPVYFVAFYPDPVPGQRLRDVMEAEAMFIDEVAKRHPKAPGKPCVIGNCQAGWAVAGLAALKPELVGPIVLNGAPLSYWAGSDKQNPMRYTGGMLGGSWLQAMFSDLGGGIFDGAYLVQNFENMNPANTLWGKPYNLYANIDTEAPRYLEFERWWGGYFRMTAEEIDSIVNQLFVGNRLAAGIALPDGTVLDLHNIASPILVFASWGDDITPPQQALNWIIDVYGHESAIVEAEQTIVYLLHEDVGHLGIFVGAKVARKEHAELVNVMDMVEALPPGLYEMVIDAKSEQLAHGELEAGQYTVRFEPRTMDQLRSIDADTREDETVFSTVAQVSEVNDRLYKSVARPLLQAMVNPATGEMMRRLNPGKLERLAWSDLNPWMAGISALADKVRAERKPVAEDNFFLALERQMSDGITQALNLYRDTRDAWVAGTVKAMYGPLGLGALFPPAALAETQSRELAAQKLAELGVRVDEKFDQGGFAEGLARMLQAVARRRGAIERRSFLIGRQLRDELLQAAGRTPQDWERIVHEQALLMTVDAERAVAALPKLIKTKAERQRAVDVMAKVMMLEPELGDAQSDLAKRVQAFLASAEADSPAAAPPTRIGTARRSLKGA